MWLFRDRKTRKLAVAVAVALDLGAVVSVAVVAGGVFWSYCMGR